MAMNSFCIVESFQIFENQTEYNVYFYSDSGKLFHIEHHYQYINHGETKKLKSDDRTLYDETQKFEIGKVVVYQNESN